jgi:tRNA threonylcarbamoyladenosine biosynthesis protein TsaB
LRPVILAFDAAGLECSALVAVGETVLSAGCVDCRHGQAELLMPTVDEVVLRAGVSPGDLDIVATTVGPGSFTGIRVGLAAAHGVALAAKARLVGVTRFEAVAAASGELDEGYRGFLLVAVESRREDLYVQLFDYRRNPVAKPEAIMPAALREMVSVAIGEAPLLVAGDAAERAALSLAQRRKTGLLRATAPVVTGILRKALHQQRSGGGGNAVTPLYLRAPDVTPPLGRRTLDFGAG